MAVRKVEEVAAKSEASQVRAKENERAAGDKARSSYTKIAPAVMKMIVAISPPTNTRQLGCYANTSVRLRS